MGEQVPSRPGELTRPLGPDEADQLNADILAGHRSGDNALLAMGYRTGGQHAELSGNSDAACFLFTQAYIFALRAGLTDIADDLWTRLKAHDREA